MAGKNPQKAKGKCMIGRCRKCGIVIRYKHDQICVNCSYGQEEEEEMKEILLGLMADYAYTSGSFSNAISKLRTMGIIKRDGEIYG